MIEGLLGDCCGPGSSYDTTRQHLSTYAWDHYGDLDRKRPGEPRPGSVLRVLERGLELAGDLPAGPILDLGCAVGRSSFALAGDSDRLVLGVDLSFPMLRLASEALRRGRVRYPRRRVGVVYDAREIPVSFPRMEAVDFWAVDAIDLPFNEGTFAAVVALNVLDCVASPHDLLASLPRLLEPGGKAILSTPYDWSPRATPIEAWLGGHSQRGERRCQRARPPRPAHAGGPSGCHRGIADRRRGARPPLAGAAARAVERGVPGGSSGGGAGLNRHTIMFISP